MAEPCWRCDEYPCTCDGPTHRTKVAKIPRNRGVLVARVGDVVITVDASAGQVALTFPSSQSATFHRE